MNVAAITSAEIVDCAPKIKRQYFLPLEEIAYRWSTNRMKSVSTARKRRKNQRHQHQITTPPIWAERRKKPSKYFVMKLKRWFNCMNGIYMTKGK